MAQVVAIEDSSEIFIDPRGDGRALRVNCHTENDLVVFSVWREDRCVATARVEAADVPALIQVLIRGLAASLPAPAATARTAARAG